jgi:uncharacterized coiled-coil DUF342 family protein
MSRQRDYQPTIDRANNRVEIARSRESRLREKSDENHRAMLRAQVAARIAGEEADALRDRITGLEQSVRDLRKDNAHLRADRKSAYELVGKMSEELDAVAHPWRSLARRAREWVRDMMRIGVEA